MSTYLGCSAVSSRGVREGGRLLDCGNGTMMEVYPGSAKRIPKNSDVGGWHAAFWVDDLESAIAKLKACDEVRVQGEPKYIESGVAQGLHWIYFTSPWGTQMELVSYDRLGYQDAHPTPMYRAALEGPLRLGACKSSGMDHIGFTVDDLDAAAAFLTNVLGCEELFENEVPYHPTGEWCRENLDVHPRASLRLKMFRVGNGANWEVFQYASPDQQTVLPSASEVGNYTLSLAVGDAVEVTKQLEATQVKVQSEGDRKYVVAPWGTKMYLMGDEQVQQAEMVSRAVSWGVLSTSKIGEKIMAAVDRSIDNGLRAVSSRSLEKLQSWSMDRKLDETVQLYGSSSDLFADTEVDNVYIPLPTGVRTDVVVDAAKAGKHILCEKPVAPSMADCERIIDACIENGVHFMDGMMWVHHPRTYELLRTIQNQSFGTVRSIKTSFHAVVKDEGNIRSSAAMEPLGALGDLGWYCIGGIVFFSQQHGSFRIPSRVALHASEQGGVITSAVGHVWFDATADAPVLTASFDCSFDAAFSSTLEVAGPDSVLRADSFVFPAGLDLYGQTLSEFRDRPTPSEAGTWQTLTNGSAVWESHSSAAAVQEVEMLERFSRESRHPSENRRWAAQTLLIQSIVEGSLASHATGTVVNLDTATLQSKISRLVSSERVK